MTILQITSVAAPFNRPALLSAALGLVRRALGVGLLAERDRIDRLDLDLVRDIAREASRAGVGRDAATGLIGAATPARLGALMRRLDGALAESPLPALELAELVRVYDLDGLAGLAGTSVPSLRRYAAGTRAIPDALAARLHFLALVTSDLAGSYNEVGLRRWWDRPRMPLGGRSPREALGRAWQPDDPAARAVAALAAALVGVGPAS